MKLETPRLRLDATWSDVAEAIGYAMRPARDVSQATEEQERSFSGMAEQS